MAKPDSKTEEPLAVYYDKSCPMCRREIEGLDEATAGSKLQLVDCSDTAFADEAAERHGIDRTQMLEALHVRDAKGEWHTGINAFALLYRKVGLTRMARVLDSKTLSPMLSGFYRWFARNRTAISRLSLPKLYVAWLTRRVKKRFKVEQETLRS